MVFEGLIQNLVDGLILGVIYSIASIGLSLAFGVMHIINVSHGDLMILGAFIAYTIWIVTGANPLLAVIPVVLLLGSIGYLFQRYLISRIIGGPPLATLVLFFGVAIALPNLIIMIWGPYSRTIIDPVMSASYKVGFLEISFGRILTAALALIILISIVYFLYRTKLGIAIRASAQNREGAILCGVNVKQIYQITMAIAFSLAGMSGVLVGINYAFTPVQGPTYTLLSFLIVVMGGMGYVPGSIISGILVGLVQSMVSSYMGTTYVYAVIFAILYLLLLLMPKGIMGRGI
ncbi:MAG: branched-chain amino acid ABC transporter permease [Sulfolobales archaeon]